MNDLFTALGNVLFYSRGRRNGTEEGTMQGEGNYSPGNKDTFLPFWHQD